MHANGFAKKILPWYYKLQDKCANKFVVKVTIIIISNAKCLSPIPSPSPKLPPFF